VTDITTTTTEEEVLDLPLTFQDYAYLAVAEDLKDNPATKKLWDGSVKLKVETVLEHSLQLAAMGRVAEAISGLLFVYAATDSERRGGGGGEQEKSKLILPDSVTQEQLTLFDSNGQPL